MSSQTPTEQALHREDESAGPIQNAAARDTPATDSSNPAAAPCPSDSKRSNAAQLARELGSSSPWSETLIPQSYRTSPRSNSAHAEIAMGQEPGTMDNNNTSQAEQDLDPPPAYSRVAAQENPMRDASAAAVVTTTNSTEPVRHVTDESDPLPSANVRQDQEVPVEADVETPLLAQPSLASIGGMYSRWRQRRNIQKRRRRRFVFAVIFFCIVASVLVGFLVGDHQGASWFHRPSTKYGQPLVDTDHVYERHETTEDIYGTYKLWERLVLTTTTGTIDVEIDPQPGDGPAILFLSSDIGSVTVRISDAYLRRRKRAQRTIYTEIHSLTGTICAEILLGYGGRATVESTTGVQSLSVLTSGVGPDDEVSNLTTTTGTGTQKVVLTSLDSEHIPVSSIRGVHQSFATASLDIVYSPAWVGRVHAAASPFGLVSVVGDDLEYTEKEADSIVAFRGSGRDLTLTEVISKGTGNASWRSSK